eukprot:1144828-Pelagomonas_calceolata.AAC.3
MCDGCDKVGDSAGSLFADGFHFLQKAQRTQEQQTTMCDRREEGQCVTDVTGATARATSVQESTIGLPVETAYPERDDRFLDVAKEGVAGEADVIGEDVHATLSGS